jgi:protein-L-isoaspartate(D-aspartate) O-methyltransferase
MSVPFEGPIFDGKRTVPSPRCRCLILEMLKLTDADKVLEIGTGSGTQTHDMAQTGAMVHSIELEPWIDVTIPVGDCVYLHSGDGFKGLPERAPFTAIVATCGIEQIPKAWEDQLADGGRLLAPIGDASNQRLTLFRKHGTDLIPERIAAYVRFQMLRDKPVPKPPKYQPAGVIA